MPGAKLARPAALQDSRCCAAVWTRLPRHLHHRGEPPGSSEELELALWLVRADAQWLRATLAGPPAAGQWGHGQPAAGTMRG